MTRSPNWYCPIESTPVAISEHNCKSLGRTFSWKQYQSTLNDAMHDLKDFVHDQKQNK